MTNNRKLFNINNILTTLKAIAASIVVGVVGIIPMALVYVLRTSMTTSLQMIGWVISGVWILFCFLFWGYLVNKWWKWE